MNLLDFFTETDFGRYIATFFISMVPVIELRGAIPIGVGMGLGHMEAMLISIIGNMVPVPFIILFVRRIFAWMKHVNPKLGALAERFEKRAYKKRDVIKKWEIFGLVILVAIPLPGTGAWTGALVAALFNIRIRSAISAIFVGVVIAGILVTGITYGFTTIL